MPPIIALSRRFKFIFGAAIQPVIPGFEIISSPSTFLLALQGEKLFYVGNRPNHWVLVPVIESGRANIAQCLQLPKEKGGE